MKNLNDKEIDLTLTDPPYGINLEYDVYDDSIDNWKEMMTEVIPEMVRVSKMVITPVCQIRLLEWIYKNFPPDWLICWYKGSVGHQAYIGFNDWEPLAVYGRRTNKMSMHDHCRVRSSPPKGSFGHPCPKPVKWARWFIDRASLDGDLIFDPFSGSGTTGVAAIESKRRFVGCDISENYTRIANKRIHEAATSANLLGF